MNGLYEKLLAAAIFFTTVFISAPILAVTSPTVNAGTDIHTTAGQTVTLQGSAYDPSSYYLNYRWSCNGGQLSSPNSLQTSFTTNSAGFGQTITYTCILAVTNNYGMSASDTVLVYASYGSSPGYFSGFLDVAKRGINLTVGNLSWSSYVSARPGDILSFGIILQAGAQDVHNVIVRDSLPSNLLYRGNLTVNTNQANGDISSGISIGTVYAGQVVIVSYQVQVPPASNFAYGITTINNTAVVTGTEVGTQTANVSVAINNSAIYGASSISTGLTNNILKDSLFMPIALFISALFIGLKIRGKKKREQIN